MTYEQMNLLDLLRGDERQVEPIDREMAKPFVERIHYSRKLPSNVVYQFGLFEGGGIDRRSDLRNTCFSIVMRWISRTRKQK